ncbi:hypothetical protein FSARC_3615 [Fusarium sarcochroum]|uniref:F-box domain-containing protein n=1 Tax=Fusarium sarcochroum TaxID=1208366 RepID=A0A8H4XBN2_9HYPO|nr:hypothetical protein FSARC_3615 [Fusarium sarcochroum]
MSSHITIIPASTKAGKETIRVLLASPEKPLVRGVYRDTSKAPAEYTEHPNFEAVKGDVANGDSLNFNGTEAVLYVPPPTYEKIDQADWAKQAANNVKNALQSAGVKKLVVLSGLGSQYDHGIGLVRLNHHTDQVLKDSVAEVTTIQSTHFQEEFQYMFQMPLGDPPTISSWIAPGEYKVPIVSVKDVGDICALCLLAKPGKAGTQTIKIMGPQPYSSNDLRDIFEEVTGEKVELRLAQGEDLKAFFRQLFPEHCIPDFMEMIESSLPGGLITNEYDYDENTVRGNIELLDTMRELSKKHAGGLVLPNFKLRAQDAQEPVMLQPKLPVEEPKKSTKRKAPATKTTDKPVAKVQKKAAGTTARKVSKASAQTPTSSTADALSVFPSEILNLILNFSDTKSLGRLSKTSKSYYALVTPQLYRRINVAVGFHAHIAKLIRTLEPHLTIAQRKQLKKEGQYRGQQESFSNKLDPRKKPEIADHVRQIILGIGDPGKKHRFIVHRYAEEALKNMNNLEIVETMILTGSMAKSLAGLKNLKALNLSCSDLTIAELKPLTAIKDLKHLTIETRGYDHDYASPHIPHDLIFNSRSTLRSLTINTSPYLSSFLYWDRNEKEEDVTLDSKYILSSLKSFSLIGVSIDQKMKKSLAKIIDFVGLEELEFGYMSENPKLLSDYLGDVFSAAHKDPTRDIKLRKLSLDVSANDYSFSPQDKEVILDSRMRFVSSFDTLTSLVLKEYNEYKDDVPGNPELKNSHLQAILKHENLVKLRIPYRGVCQGYKIPYLEPATVKTLIDNLPKLEEIAFAPEKSKIEEIAKILSLAPSLTSITLSPCGTYEYGVDREATAKSILKSIVDGVFDHSIDKNAGKFNWEDHSNIKRVYIDHMVYELGSKFGKPQKGMKKAEKFTTTLSGPFKQKREVLYRDIMGYVHAPIESGFDPKCEWINKVEKDLD